jgi:hypothetical protein
MNDFLVESRFLWQALMRQVAQFFRGLLRARRGPWELVATVLIALGICMLMQPFALWIFSHSFSVILTGTVLFLIVSHFPQ